MLSLLEVYYKVSNDQDASSEADHEAVTMGDVSSNEDNNRFV